MHCKLFHLEPMNRYVSPATSSDIMNCGDESIDYVTYMDVDMEWIKDTLKNWYGTTFEVSTDDDSGIAVITVKNRERYFAPKFEKFKATLQKALDRCTPENYMKFDAGFAMLSEDYDADTDTKVYSGGYIDTMDSWMRTRKDGEKFRVYAVYDFHC